MNRRLPTILDDLFPDSSPEFAAIADTWPEHVIVQMLALVWDAFDRLKTVSNFRQLDFSKQYAQLERSLTDLHMIQVTELHAERGTDFESFIPQHEAWEFEHLTKPSARPPSCEIGFVFRNNYRLRWSVEAKVLKSPTEISEYLGELENYLHGGRSPLSPQAALGAYLVSGPADDLFSTLASALGQPLTTHNAFPSRPHRLSQHERDNLPAVTPRNFICHHLVFSLT